MKRKTKKFQDSNANYLFNTFEEWIDENQNIEIEHMTSFYTGCYAHIIITYFEND
jgi:hypothetical protein